MNRSTELEIFRDVAERLESVGLDYMLTGSLAMNYYATPRMTRDINLVVALNSEDSTRVKQLFTNDYYVPTHSEFQLRDVRNLSGSDMNLDYLRKWAPRLGVADLLEACLDE